MTTKKVPIAALVEDFSIYPRHDVDSTHVTNIAHAIRAGVTIPMPICEVQSLRIVDGFHRVRAHKRVYGDQAEIEVELRRYKSETELIKEAVTLNSAHGRKFDQQDRTRCILLLKEHGVELDDIAVTLHTTTERVERLMVRVVIVDGEKHPAKPITFPTGDKPRKLTAAQYAVAQSSSGWRPQQTVTQLANEIRSGVLDLKNDALVEALWVLHDAIESKVPKLQT